MVRIKNKEMMSVYPNTMEPVLFLNRILWKHQSFQKSQFLCKWERVFNKLKPHFSLQKIPLNRMHVN